MKYRQELKLVEREKFELKVKRANAQAQENNQVNQRFLVLLNSEASLRAKINAMYYKVCCCCCFLFLFLLLLLLHTFVSV